MVGERGAGSVAASVSGSVPQISSFQKALGMQSVLERCVIECWHMLARPRFFFFSMFDLQQFQK